jgi:hypothetical protein
MYAGDELYDDETTSGPIDDHASDQQVTAKGSPPLAIDEAPERCQQCEFELARGLRRTHGHLPNRAWPSVLR